MVERSLKRSLFSGQPKGPQELPLCCQDLPAEGQPLPGAAADNLDRAVHGGRPRPEPLCQEDGVQLWGSFPTAPPPAPVSSSKTRHPGRELSASAGRLWPSVFRPAKQEEAVVFLSKSLS